jgi:hypothetical protein
LFTESVGLLIQVSKSGLICVTSVFIFCVTNRSL